MCLLLIWMPIKLLALNLNALKLCALNVNETKNQISYHLVVTSLNKFSDTIERLKI